MILSLPSFFLGNDIVVTLFRLCKLSSFRYSAKVEYDLFVALFRLHKFSSGWDSAYLELDNASSLFIYGMWSQVEIMEFEL